MEKSNPFSDEITLETPRIYCRKFIVYLDRCRSYRIIYNIVQRINERETFRF